MTSTIPAELFDLKAALKPGAQIGNTRERVFDELWTPLLTSVGVIRLRS
jgi:hypothetical protein